MKLSSNVGLFGSEHSSCENKSDDIVRLLDKINVKVNKLTNILLNDGVISDDDFKNIKDMYSSSHKDFKRKIKQLNDGQ